MECGACGTEIPFESPYHSLVLSEEKREPDGVAVLEAAALLELCEKCAGEKDLDYGMKVFSSKTGGLVPLDSLEHVHADKCWECGSLLGDGPYFSLVHYHEKLLPAMEVEVIDAVDLLYLCPACRAPYDFDRLELAPSSGSS